MDGGAEAEEEASDQLYKVPESAGACPPRPLSFSLTCLFGTDCYPDTGTCNW